MSPPKRMPEAVTPRAARLEKVRMDAGMDSLHEFWKSIKDDLPEGARSYEAVRNYHFDRDAPVDYYIAVAKAYDGVSLHWLLTGEGEMDPAAEAAGGGDPTSPLAEKLSAVLSRLPAWGDQRHDYRSMFGHSFLELVRAARWELETTSEEDLFAVAEGLWDLESLPWRIINGNEPDAGDVRYPVYALTQLAAIRTAIPRGFSSEDAAERCLDLLAALPGLVVAAMEVLGDEVKGVPAEEEGEA